MKVNHQPISRLCDAVIPAFRADGSVRDLAAPMVEEINLTDLASTLARIARFNSAHSGLAYFVAQHSVLGAEALLTETGDPLLAALYLFHDGHEYVLGDQTSPQQQLYDALTDARFCQARCAAATAWDVAIYRAVGLPEPDAWKPQWKAKVKAMDQRMLAVEVEALFGAEAAREQGLSIKRRPAFRGALKPWGSMKAEEEFLAWVRKLLGEEPIYDTSAQYGAHLSLSDRISRKPSGARP